MKIASIALEVVAYGRGSALSPGGVFCCRQGMGIAE